MPGRLQPNSKQVLIWHAGLGDGLYLDGIKRRLAGITATPNTVQETLEYASARDSRAEQYRDVLELWTEWWNGPGRQGYRDPIIPH